MKYRTSFVTNSSSSSFIIGKKEDTNVTIEFVYQIVRDLYIEFLNKREDLIKYINEHPDLGLIYIKETENNYSHFKFKNDKRENWERNRLIRKQIEKDFGISDYDYFNEEYDWTKCETYEEYEKYWLNNKSNDPHKHAPFTIADFLESKEINWVHLGRYKGEISKELHDISYTSDVVGWYYCYIEDIFDCSTCEDCSNYKWCKDYCKEECDKTRLKIKDKEVQKDKACLCLLGRVCIYSECGYIPEYVVEKLREISEYSCNHMG